MLDLLIRKEISILLSAVFIITLISSTPVQSVRVSGAENQDVLYSVSVTPALVKVPQGEFGTFDVKVQRGSDEGQFIVDLSLAADSSLPRGAVTFNPPSLDLEQGQTAANSTMKINSHGLDTGPLRFRVQAAMHTPVGSDQALSNPAALIVTDSLSPSGPTDASTAQIEENNRVIPEATLAPTQPNHAPIAKAGQDQSINEGERGTLDGSASTDPDKDALSYSWEQLVPRQPSVKLVTSDASGKASFIAPDVDRDTVFRFNLIAQDGNGGQAVDSINVLVKNVAVAESPAPEQEEEQQQAQSQTPSSEGGEAPIETPAATENHSPTVETLQTVLANDGNPLTFSLKGNDADNEDTISYLIVTDPSKGTIAGFDKATGSLTYVPNADFAGQDRLSFKVVDSQGAESNVGVVVIRSASTSPPSTPPSTPEESAANTTSTTSSPSQSPSSTATQVGGNATGSTQNANASKVRAENNTSPIDLTASTSFSTLAATASGEIYNFIKKWNGTESGLVFNKPHDLDTDGSGNVLVVDTENNRVVKFSSTGKFIPTTGFSGLLKPQGIAINKVTGDVYVVDTGHNSIKKYSSTCTPCVFGTSGQGQVNTPVDVGIDRLGNVFVSDLNNHRMVKYDSNGVFKFKFGTTGSALGKVEGPHSIAIDKQNTGSDILYVVDIASSKLRVIAYDTNNGGWIQSLSFDGSNGGQRFALPHGIAFYSDHSAFVSDFGAKNMRKFTNAGVSLTAFGAPGAADGQFNGPDGVTVNATGAVFVTDTVNNNVQIFDIDRIAPIVVSTEPAADEVDVPVDVVINATFSEAMDPSSINTNTFKLFTGDGLTQVTGTVTLSADGKVASFTPTSPLDKTSPTYTATITTGVKDKAGNSLAAEFVWSFKIVPTILLTVDNAKWGLEATGSGSATNPQPGDTISLDWGDGTTPSEVALDAGGLFSATHTYDISAMSPSPEKTVVAILLDSQGVERTRTELLVTIQKHNTAMTVGFKPAFEGSLLCLDCPFTVFGILTDTDTQKGVAGKAITFSGSGVPASLSSVQTGGLKFSGTPNANLTVTSSQVELPLQSEIAFPTTTHGASYVFDNAVKLSLTKGNDEVISDVQAGEGSVQNADFPEGLKKITITDASGGIARLVSIVARDLSVDGPDDHHITLNFTSKTADPGEFPDEGEYSTLEISPGSYFSKTTSQSEEGGNLPINAAFEGNSDPAYLSSAAELRYDASSQAGTGLSIWTDYTGSIFNTLTVGSATTTDACTAATGSPLANTFSLDADKDGICDKWELPANTPAGPDTGRNAFIICPTKVDPLNAALKTFIDNTCTNTDASIKYDLCITDAFSDAWGGSANQRICPRVGHKDMFVEIDYMKDRSPSTTAIKNVIRAFGNAPNTLLAPANTAADSFGRTDGITLHVVISDEFPRQAYSGNSYSAWKDGDATITNDFKSVKESLSCSVPPCAAGLAPGLFGTAAERAGTSGMPGMTGGSNGAWATTGDTMKHYVYHYGQWISYYGAACVDSADSDTLVDGLSSGLSEQWGNDYLISLGCGFNGPVDPSGNAATKLGSKGTDEEQAGTLMHELGHNLNLDHGGARTIAVGSNTWSVNCKPYYASVMNYARQVPNALISASEWFSGGNYGTQAGVKMTSLDFQRTNWPAAADVFENTINEGTTLTPTDGKLYNIVWGTPGAVNTNPTDGIPDGYVSGYVNKQNSGTQINFNLASGIQAAVSVSVDTDALITTTGTKIGGCGTITNPAPFVPYPNNPNIPERLASKSDWDKISMTFLPQPTSRDGAAPTPRNSLPFINPNTRELPPVFLQAIQSAVSQVEFIPPPNPDGSSTFNTGSTVPMKFRLKDLDGNPVTNAVVTMVAEKGAIRVVGSTPFVYDPVANVYKFEWSTTVNAGFPSGNAGKGEWTIKYIENYLSVNPALPEHVLEGPFSNDGSYTYKITGVK